MLLDIEKTLEDKLATELGKDKGRDRFAHYTLAKEPLPDALNEIKGKHPEYTGHDIGHINRVLEKAYMLLGTSIDEINCEELYLLLMAILFHDSGMLISREDHQNKIDLVFDHIRGTGDEIRPEKKWVKRIVRAHSGKGLDDTADTLKDVDEKVSFNKKDIRLRELSAILRFADELEEDKGRAANFALETDRLPDSSTKYHEYSRGIQVHIDRLGGRIVIGYNCSVAPDEKDFESRICYIFERITKLDNERRYVKYYSGILSPFKETQVTIDFWGKGNEEIEHLSEQFVLDDKVLPSSVCGDDIKEKKEKIIAKIKEYNTSNESCPPSKSGGFLGRLKALGLLVANIFAH